ncbi:hypothetical protein Tco_0302803 [Tanacetum coccineum]
MGSFINSIDPHHTPTIIQPSTSQPHKKKRPRKPKRKDTEIPQSSGLTDNVADEAVNEEMDDSLQRAATTVTSLDAEQDRGNINKTQSKETPNEAGSKELLQVVVLSAKKPWGILLLKLGLRMYLKHLMIHCSQEETDIQEKDKIEAKTTKPSMRNRQSSVRSQKSKPKSIKKSKVKVNPGVD